MAENYDDLGEKAQNARRALEMEREKLMKQEEQLDARLQLLDNIDKVLEENKRLRETVEEHQQQLDEEKRQRSAVEMKLMEMNKLSAGMAKKASEDNLLKALRTYVNRSKRKTADKRAFAKSATLEIANVTNYKAPKDTDIYIINEWYNWKNEMECLRRTSGSVSQIIPDVLSYYAEGNSIYSSKRLNVNVKL